MSKRLILMRHAQSDDFEHSRDFERPLSVRGQQNAAHMRHWFHAQSYHPQNALVSAAKRTVENCNAFLSKALYLAPATTLLTALKKTTGPSVLMIGHNFGISDLANRLRKDRSENPKFKIFPPGAIWVADLPIEDWRALTWGAASSVNFASPQDVRTKLSNGPRR